MSDSQSYDARCLEQRVADRKAIDEAQRRLKAARRAVYVATLKRARRAKRVEAAVRAFEESLSEIETAQAALKVAQEANDRAFLDAVTHRLAEETACADQLSTEQSPDNQSEQRK